MRKALVVASVMLMVAGISPAGVASALTLADDATGGDCVLVGAWDPGSKTCTLNSDVYEGISVADAGITLDCDRHTLTGSGFSAGVFLAPNKDSITVRKCEITNFGVGIWAQRNSYITLSENVVGFNLLAGIWLIGDSPSGAPITAPGVGNKVLHNTVSYNNWHGIFLLAQTDATIDGNTADGNTYIGLGIHRSPGNVITDNSMSGNGANLSFNTNKWNFAEGGDFVQASVVGNTVDGADVLYIDGQTGGTIDYASHPNAKAICCVNCSGVTLDGSGYPDQWFSNNGNDVLLANSTDSTIQHFTTYKNAASGNWDWDRFVSLAAIDSDGIRVSDNTINGNSLLYGMHLQGNDITAEQNTFHFPTQRDVWDGWINGTPLQFTRATNSAARFNAITGGLTGIGVNLGTEVTVVDNNLNGPMLYGLFLEAGGHHHFVRNTLRDMTHTAIYIGSDLEPSTINGYNEVGANVIRDSCGIIMLSRSSYNTIRDNLIKDMNCLNVWGEGAQEGITITSVGGRFPDGGHNIFAGNRIVNMAGGLLFRSGTNQNEVRSNVIRKNRGVGIKLLNSDDNRIYWNDVFLNDGWAVSSDLAVELSYNGAGNWWHGDCGRGLFVEGEDSNAVGVVDSYPYAGAVAHIPDPSEPAPCPL